MRKYESEIISKESESGVNEFGRLLGGSWENLGRMEDNLGKNCVRNDGDYCGADPSSV